jgi:hypothetical protein
MIGPNRFSETSSVNRGMRTEVFDELNGARHRLGTETQRTTKSKLTETK